MSNTRDSLEWVSRDEAREILALLEGVEKLILVGGQAVSFWAEFYAEDDDHLQKNGPYASRDVDFLAGRAEVSDAAACLGVEAFVPTIDDHTPSTGKLTFTSQAGKAITIDFMGELYGLSRRDVVNTSIKVEWSGVRFLVMHPLLCLESRLANSFGSLHRQSEHSFQQLDASIHIVRQHIASELQQGHQRIALNLTEQVAQLAVEDPAKEAYVTRRIDVLQAVPAEAFESAAFQETRWPQIVAETARKREQYSKVMAQRPL